MNEPDNERREREQDRARDWAPASTSIFHLSSARTRLTGISALAAALVIVVLAVLLFAARGAVPGIPPGGPASPTARTVHQSPAPTARPIKGMSITAFPIDHVGAGPQTIVRGADGNLWYTSPPAAILSRITPDGHVTEFRLSQHMPLWSLAAGPDGNIWVTEAGGPLIGRITPTGQLTMFTVPLPAGAELYGITTGPDGNLWFTEYAFQSHAGRIGRITPSGHATVFPLPDPNGSPKAITAGPDGAVWFTESGTDVIGRVSPDGTIREYSLSPDDGSLMSIALGPDGNLWCTQFKDSDTSEGIRDHIVRVTPSGAITEFAFPSTLPDPKGHNAIAITAGPDGALWFTEFGGNRIGRITPNGAITEYAPSSGAQDPYGITQGPNGTLWYTALNITPKSGSSAIARITLSYGS